MTNKPSPGYARIDRARIYSIDAFEPATVGAGKTKLYRVTAIIEKSDPDFERLIKAPVNAFMRIFTREIKSHSITQPFSALIEGDQLLGRNGKPVQAAQGSLVIRAASRNQPLLLDANNIPLNQDTGLLYPGCYARLIIDFYPILSGTVRPGVYASWLGLRFAGDGDRLRRAPARKHVEVTAASFDEEDDDRIENCLKSLQTDSDFGMT
jgi:hypothetical protein